MFWFFKKRDEKNDIIVIKSAVQTGFSNVKNDINNLTKWIKHLDSRDTALKRQVNGITDDFSVLKDEVEQLKNIISLIGERPIFKQKQTLFRKQTGVYSNLNTVQTDVQTSILNNLTAHERAIVFLLLNSDMKLSYEDLAAMLGKNKATIRGQVNNIKQKSEGFIEEIIGESNKKRIFIPEKTKELLLKIRKVRGRSKEKLEGHERNE
ncbi:MAG: hypothetical protein RL557_823 [archaeon]|jgi:hypothetical protein